jgi:hypothetical protein
MKTHSIHFFLLNDDFSPEYADANHSGKETENNLKYEWEDEIVLKNEILGFSITEENYLIQGYLPDDSIFSYEIPRTTLIKAVGMNDEVTIFAVSTDLIDSYNEVILEDEVHMNVYLKDYEPYTNPSPGVFIVSNDFPKELVALTRD